MKETIIVDTGVIVQYLKTGKGALPTAYEKYKMVIASTTYTELLSSETFNDSALEKEVIDFVNKYFSVVDVSKEVALEASRVVRESGLNLAASIIAAVARVQGIKVLTDDAKQFGRVTGLNFAE